MNHPPSWSESHTFTYNWFRGGSKQTKFTKQAVPSTNALKQLEDRFERQKCPIETEPVPSEPYDSAEIDKLLKVVFVLRQNIAKERAKTFVQCKHDHWKYDHYSGDWVHFWRTCKTCVVRQSDFDTRFPTIDRIDRRQ